MRWSCWAKRTRGSGVHERARKACEEAAAIARRSDDPTLLAEAALALGVEIVPGVVTAALVALLEEAKASCHRHRPLRAKVLARLAAALQPAPDPVRAHPFAREAVAMARALGDTTTMRACLHMGGSALVDLRRARRALRVGRRAAPPFARRRRVIAALRAHARLLFDYLELGRPRAGGAQIAAHEKLADELGLPRYQWLTLMMRSMRAISDGRFEESETLRERARRIRQRVKMPEIDAGFYIQSWGPALARGEALPNIQEILEATAHFPDANGMAIMTRIFDHRPPRARTTLHGLSCRKSR